MCSVSRASAASKVQASRQFRSGVPPVPPKKWSLTQNESNPDLSAPCARSQISGYDHPAAGETMTPSFTSRCYGPRGERSLSLAAYAKIAAVRTAALLIAGSVAVVACVSPNPTIVRGTTLVPPISSHAQYGDIGITLDIPDRLGQPAEDIVWHIDPFKPPVGYAARIASVLG